MKFKNWVKIQNKTTLAEKLKIQRATIYAWFNGPCCTPRPKLMKRLVELGDGAFSLEDIVNDTIRGQR